MNLLAQSKYFLSKFKWVIIGAFFMMIISTITGLVIPQYIQKIIDDGVTVSNIEVIKTVAISLIIVTIIKAFATFFETYWSQVVSQGIAYDLRKALFQKLEYLQFSFYDRFQIGQLLTRATNDVEMLRNFFATGILQIAASILTFLGSVAILVNTNWRLFLLVGCVLPIIIIIFAVMFRKLRPIFGSIQKNKGLLNNILQENILGARVVKGFTAEPLQLKKYEGQNDHIYQDSLKMIQAFANGFPFVFFLSNLATLIVLFFGGQLVIKEQMSIGSLIAFNSYLTFLVQPIFRMGFITQQYAQASASSQRVFAILETPTEIKNLPETVDFSTQMDLTIEFKDVDFSYIQSRDNLALENINLKIPMGSTVAIVGKTGSGKSSLVNLIPRFYDVLSGYVSIGNVAVQHYDLESLRQNIGLVLQEIRLRSGTVRDNIKYGKISATDDEIMAVCKIAQVDDFLDKLPSGLDFEVGEGGKNLSGGQRQRVAIARMLLVEPKILILDDATSALDTNTENDLIKDAAPYLASPNHTVIVITQKLTTVQRADQIVLMDEGIILAQGSHEYLLQNSPDYITLLEESNNA